MAIAFRQSQFDKCCPRKLKAKPNSPCCLGLLRIELVEQGKRETADLPGCPYYINDCLSQYCWFNYIDRQDFAPHTTKEIAQILALTPAQVEKAETTGLKKLALLHDTDEMKEMQSCVAEFNSGNEDDTIYAIGSFTAEVIEELSQLFNTPAGEEDPSYYGNEDKRGKRKKDSKKRLANLETQPIP